MVLCDILSRWKQQQSLSRAPWRYICFRLPVLLALLVVLMVVVLARIAGSGDQLTVIKHKKTSFQFHLVEREQNIPTHQGQGPAATAFRFPLAEREQNTTVRQGQDPAATAPQRSQPPPPKTKTSSGPYHNWEIFDADYEEMLQNLKIFVYPDVFMHNQSSPFAGIFLPHPNPFDKKIGNYFSEHAFKIALLRSPLITKRPEEAQFFFMPFSINSIRYHPGLHSESSIADFVAQYTSRISSEFRYWNASEGADHFYVCCHSVGREAASKHHALHNNAIQVTCSSSYFQRLYVAHKDIGLPQVWPRQTEQKLNPPEARHRLAFFAGRVQNSRIRQELLDLWDNDTSFHVSSKHSSLTYEEGFRESKYCLHVKGYEVNTARISDALHYGCIPVIISDHYDLPFPNILDWSKFSIIISHRDIAKLKDILLSVSEPMYLRLFQNLRAVRGHFAWHMTPENYDSFYMTAYQLWLRRGLQRLAY